MDVRDGCVRLATEHKGDGIFAARPFSDAEVVIKGGPVRSAIQNDMYAVQTGLEQFGHEEGLASIVNHSCDPNCGITLTEHGVFDLVARREIVSGEEVTVDYAMRNYVIEFFPRNCLCGSTLCRSSVTGWKDLPPERRSAYRGSVAPFIFTIEGGLRELVAS